VERKRGQRYSKEFRRQAVERMNSCDNIVGLAQELGVCRRILYNWRDQLDETNPPARAIPRVDPAKANYQTKATVSE
jgi:transposase-like protein